MTKKQLRRLAKNYNQQIQQALSDIRYRKKVSVLMGVSKEIIAKTVPSNLKFAWHQVKAKIRISQLEQEMENAVGENV